jgi:hypothetical protein
MENDLLTEVPDKQRGDYKRLITADKLFGIVCIAAIIGASRLTNRLGVGATVIICLLLMKTVRYGRVYYVIGQECKNLWLRYVKRGSLWQKRAKKSLLARRPPIPLVTAGIGNIGLLFNVSDNTDSVVIAVEGSDAVSRGLAHRFYVQRVLAKLNEELAAMFSDYGISLGYMQRKRPVVDVDMQENYMHNLHPDVAVADVNLSPADEAKLSPRELRALRLRRNVNQVHEIEMANGCTPLQVITLTIRREGVLHKAFSHGTSLAEDSVRHLDVSKITTKTINYLENNGISGAHALSAPELLDYTRGGWDLVTLQDYHYQRAGSNFLDSVFGGDVSTGESLSDTSPVHMPQVAIDVYRDHMVIDGTYCGVIELTKGPNLAEPFYDDELYSPADIRWPAITAVASSTKTTSDTLLVGAGINLSRTLTENLFSRKTAKMQLRERRQLEHEETLSVNRFFLSYKRYIAIVNDDWSKFVQETEDMMAIADRIGLGPRRVKGECRQLPHFLSATLALPIC